MKEKSQGYAVLEDIDTATFVRFLEWTYRGNYTTPTSTNQASPSEEGPVAEGQGDLGDWGCFNKPSSKKKRSKLTENPDWGSFGFDQSGRALRDGLRQAFIDRTYIELTPTNPTLVARRNENENEDYNSIFMCHAQLYVFAEEKDIQKLKTLALESLHETLKHFTLYDKRIGDVVSLVRYVYQNTLPPESTGAEPMRALLTEYIGFEMDTLLKHEDFRNLIIEDGGSLLADLATMVMRRI